MSPDIPQPALGQEPEHFHFGGVLAEELSVQPNIKLVEPVFGKVRVTDKEIPVC